LYIVKALLERNLVMVVDDEIDILNLFKEVLNLNGINTRTFSDPQTAVEEFEKNHSNYKLVISDIRMSPISGFEFVKKLSDIDPAVKVIFMTAFEIERDKIKELNTNEFFSKPIKMDNLVQLVKKYVK
jgi:DNA-binding NtrC family response regulator